MELFLNQAKDVDIIITTALIRTSAHARRHVGLTISWTAGAQIDH
jgi:hypothetical protein